MLTKLNPKTGKMEGSKAN